MAKVACGGKTGSCMVKVDKISKEYDGKALMLDLDRGGSEWHLVSKKTARFWHPLCRRRAAALDDCLENQLGQTRGFKAGCHQN